MNTNEQMVIQDGPAAALSRLMESARPDMAPGQLAELQETISRAVASGVAEAFRPVAALEALRHKMLLTPAEAAELIGVPAGTLRNWRNMGKGPDVVKQGNKVLYPVKALEKWAEVNRVRNQ
jgi:DNA-binding transcriptional regulator YiaG